MSNMQITEPSISSHETGGRPSKAAETQPLRAMRVVRYKPDYSGVWNDFVLSAVNSTFLFDRGFLEYHADRFVDCSLLVFDGDALIALLPANIDEDRLVSHGGLTYGGLLVRR